MSDTSACVAAKTLTRSFAMLSMAIALGGCSITPLRDGPIAGKPVDELVNDLKDELAEVHWRLRSSSPACGSGGAPREVDLRQGAVTLMLERVAQVGASGDVKLVAVPLGAGLIEPLFAGDVERRAARTLTLKLEVDGSTPVVELEHATLSARPVARALNAAIDGFMRSQTREPCVRLAGLKLTLVLDVEATASGGFRLTVPAFRAAVDGSSKAVNTLTLEWAHVASNGFL